ncbi:hypothetical protein FIBSPDRAFT_175559 [Athelia psychrophila]|uniref:F-box domain-containing protein n=1 Tax=Athelia psychrophila TaxID=1759441 RepID=A0A166APP2_9AGAM|nr:hypothetical protein FIBSPDRAFT_175559 [Fibularhizoctonia sp. CBS 109695]
MLIERASTFLSRARALPLDLSFQGFRDVHFSSNFLRLISDHIGHCRQLRIVDGDNEGLTRVLKCVPSQPMPLLAAITLDCFDDAIVFHQQLFPSGVLSLTAAYISNINVQTMHFCLPAFEFLASLALPNLCISTDVEYTLFRDALVALPSLRHLELIVDIFDALSFPGRLPILLPTIKYLLVECEGIIDFNAILCCIQAASLVALSLLVRDQSDGGSFALDAGVFDFPSLQHLVLPNLTETVLYFATLVEFARNFPHIEHLTFEPSGDVDPWLHDINRILRMLRWDGDRLGNDAHMQLWPKLQSIAFLTSTEDFDVPKLQSTILKLRATGHPIRKLLLPRKAHPALVELGNIIEIEEFFVDWPTLSW